MATGSFYYDRGTYTNAEITVTTGVMGVTYDIIV